MTQCVVTIDYEPYLLPRKQALQLVDLMAQAKRLSRRYSHMHGDDKYVVLGTGHLELKTITAEELIHNEETKKGATQ